MLYIFRKRSSFKLKKKKVQNDFFDLFKIWTLISQRKGKALTFIYFFFYPSLKKYLKLGPQAIDKGMAVNEKKQTPRCPFSHLFAFFFSKEIQNKKKERR